MPDSNAARWLRASLADLQTARVLLDHQQYSACAFYSQQSAEKALKAQLLHLNHTAWGHSNKDLLETIEVAGAAGVTDAIRKAARGLDRHYIPSRYPDAYPAGVPGDYYDSEAAQEALAWAQAVVDYVLSQMPEAQS